MFWTAALFPEDGVSGCLIGLGSNVGDRARHLDLAIEVLSATPAVRVVTRSTARSTRPVGGPAGQPPYLNAAVRCETTLEPHALFQVLGAIERDMGRTRDVPWGPRTIDLDLLLYDEWIIATPELTLPHPRMAFRRFVLEPAAEIGAEMVHASTRFTVGELLARLDSVPAYVAVAAARHGLVHAALRLVQEQVGCRCVAEPSAARIGATVSSGIGRPGDRPLELLQRRAAQLTAAGMVMGAAEAREHVVSEFWLGESLAQVHCAGSIEQRTAVEEYLHTVPRHLAAPKLLVTVAAPPTASREVPGGGEASGWETDVEHEIDRLAAIPRQCAVLALRPADFQTASQTVAREIVAGLHAMEKSRS